MKQKKLNVIVTDGDGNVLYQRNPAHPQEVVSILQLFDMIGNCVTIHVEEFEIPAQGLS